MSKLVVKSLVTKLVVKSQVTKLDVHVEEKSNVKSRARLNQTLKVGD